MTQLGTLHSLPSETKVSGPADEGFIIRFSNTGPKWFCISQSQLVRTLTDIADNITDFENQAGSNYDEKPWRNIFSKFLTDEVVKAQSTVQTLPLFEILAKIISSTPGAESYQDKVIELDEQLIRQAASGIAKLSLSAPDLTTAAGTRITGGENILFYGAPGTGKSHNIWKIIDKDNDLYFTTVFHPDMQNSDFAGTLKPGVASEDGSKVTYAFRPGPFARAVAAAWANPDKKVYLVIEELNRAVAAAVFGELFQLLDREPDGSSCYQVDFPSPEFANWFVETTGMTAERLTLPSNLWILATMNSADQGVFPLDTAFRRRWTQKYVKIDYKEAAESPLTYTSANGPASTDWRIFVKALNNFLVSELGVAEDRLIGPHFLNDRDLSAGVVPGKLLIYLWDDLLRHDGRAVLFDQDIRTYGELDERATKSGRIFSDAFLEMLEETKPTSPEPE